MLLNIIENKFDSLSGREPTARTYKLFLLLIGLFQYTKRILIFPHKEKFHPFIYIFTAGHLPYRVKTPQQRSRKQSKVCLSHRNCYSIDASRPRRVISSFTSGHVRDIRKLTLCTSYISRNKERNALRNLFPCYFCLHVCFVQEQPPLFYMIRAHYSLD